MKRASLLLDLRHQDPQPATRASWYTPGLSDGLGDRLLMFDNTTASSLELLRFRAEFGDAPGFALALRDRVEQLKEFSHPSLAAVRAVEWLGDGEGLALVSDHTPGRRLSDVLHDARGATFAMTLLRQLGPALAALHKQGEDVAHGALTPDRIVVAPEGQLVLVEHVLGSALDSLNLPAARLRSDLGIVVPYHLDAMSLDHRSDVVQLAFVALSLLLGRRLDPADYPDRIEELLELAAAGTAGFRAAPRLRGWLECALEVGGRQFESAVDAHDALEEVLELHRPRVAGALAEPVLALDSDPAQEGVDSVAEQLRRSEPIVRRGAALVEFRPAESTEVAGTVLEAARPEVAAPQLTAPHLTAPQVQPKRRVPPQNRRLWWVAATFGVVSVAEGLFIAGLIYGRPALTGAPVVLAAPPSQGGPLAATPVAPPSRGAQGAYYDSSIQIGSLPGAGAATALLGTAPAAATGAQGRLEISSDPPGARVSVDGTRRGVTPLAISVAASAHIVVVSDGTTTTSRTLNVSAGGTSTMVAALGAAGSAAGWLSVTVPLDLQIFEGDTLLGSTNTRLMLPAGSHELQLVNSAVGFQTKISVDVQPGKTATANVSIPNGAISLNALPWANVSIDGKALGTTPIANIEVPLGTHEVVWRHPQFGERRQTVTVTAKAPLRLVMDLRKP